ncbi:MAG: hypothetical protein RR806_08970 [Oscillospiraceae bacterium]
MNKNFSAIVLVCLLILFTACERRDGKVQTTNSTSSQSEKAVNETSSQPEKAVNATSSQPEKAVNATSSQQKRTIKVMPTRLAKISLNTYDKMSNDYAINSAISAAETDTNISADSGSYELWNCQYQTKCLINDKKYSCKVNTNIVVWQNKEYYVICDTWVDNGKEYRTQTNINIPKLDYEIGNSGINFTDGYYKLYRKSETVPITIFQEFWKGKTDKNTVTLKFSLVCPKRLKKLDIIDQYYLDLQEDIEKIDFNNKFEIIKKCYSTLADNLIITNNWDNAAEINSKDLLRYYYSNVVQDKIFTKVPFGRAIDFNNNTYFSISEEKVETAITSLFNITGENLRTLVQKGGFAYYSPEQKSYFFRYSIKNDNNSKYYNNLYVKFDDGIISIITPNPQKPHINDVVKILMEDGGFKYLSKRKECRLIVNCWPREIKKVFYVNSSGRPTRKFYIANNYN